MDAIETYDAEGTAAGPCECYICLCDIEYGEELCSDCVVLLQTDIEAL